MQIALFQICIRIGDISFSYKIEISAFKIETFCISITDICILRIKTDVSI